MKGKIIVLEGLPGVGKTLFCESVATHDPNVRILKEWVETSCLKKYLSDMKTWATEFQFKIQEDTVKRMKEAVELAKQGFIVYVDRGIVGNRCFAELQFESGFISETDMELYRTTFSYDKIEGLEEIEFTEVYMTASTDHCLAHIKKRGRDGEGSYAKPYLESLKKKHDDLLPNAKKIPCEVEHELQDGLIPRETLRRSLEVF